MMKQPTQQEVQLHQIMQPHSRLDWLTTAAPDTNDDVLEAGELIARIWTGCLEHGGWIEWTLSTEQNLKIIIVFSQKNS